MGARFKTYHNEVKYNGQGQVSGLFLDVEAKTASGFTKREHVDIFDSLSPEAKAALELVNTEAQGILTARYAEVL